MGIHIPMEMGNFMGVSLVIKSGWVRVWIQLQRCACCSDAGLRQITLTACWNVTHGMWCSRCREVGPAHRALTVRSRRASRRSFRSTSCRCARWPATRTSVTASGRWFRPPPTHTRRPTRSSSSPGARARSSRPSRFWFFCVLASHRQPSTSLANYL